MTRRSSTRTPTRRRCWRRTRSCRSSRPTPRTAGRDVETRDISLAGRDPRQLPRPPRPTSSGSATRWPSSASWPRRPRRTSSSCRTSAPRSRSSRRPIAELQAQGYALPDYPDDPKTDEEKDVRAALRQGQGQRRQPGAARGQLRPPRARRRSSSTPATHPHSMGAWSPDSKTNVAHMTADDFRSNEKSVGHRRRRHAAHRAASPTTARPPCCASRCRCWPARSSTRTVMRVAALREFLTAQIARAKAEDVLFSVHLKATMMKVSDPIIFGHVVRAFFPRLFAEYGDALAEAGLSPNDGLGGMLKGIESLPRGRRRSRPPSRPGIADGPGPGDGRLRQRHHQPARAERRDRRRLDAGDDPHLRPHVGPGRQGGRHAGRDPRQQLRRHLPGRHRRLPRQRRLRPGHHGLGAQRRADGAGGRGVRQPRQDLRDRPPRARSASSTGPATRCSSTTVGAGDIWRMCQTKDVPIRDWVKLAVTRARATGDPAVFWLDETRAHDANLIAKVKAYLADHDTERPATSRSWRRSTRSRSRSSGSARARTPSR